MNSKILTDSLLSEVNGSFLLSLDCYPVLGFCNIRLLYYTAVANGGVIGRVAGKYKKPNDQQCGKNK